MKKFKLFLFSFFACLLLVLPSANAEKMEYVDRDYPFKQLKSVYIYDIDLSSLKHSNNNTVQADSEFAERVLQEDYYDCSHKFEYYTTYSAEQAMRKISLATGKDVEKMIAETPEAGNQFFLDNLCQLVQAYVTAELTNYHTGSYIVPAHTEWRSVTEHEDFYDKDGKKRTHTRTIQVPEYVPDKKVSTANVTIHFSMVDTKTGKEIFSRTENRTNTFSSDCRECYRQTVRSFFRDLKKKIKEGVGKKK